MWAARKASRTKANRNFRPGPKSTDALRRCRGEPFRRHPDGSVPRQFAALAGSPWPGPCSARSAAGRRFGKGTFTQAPFERIADGDCPVWLMPAIFPRRLKPPWPTSAYADTPAVRTSAEMATPLRHPSLPRDAACAFRFAGNRSAGACFSASVSMSGVALLSASISD
jgi:hypothetical protein